MVTRYGKDPPPSTIQCFMPSYPPQLRLFPPPSNRGEPHFHMSGAPGAGPVMRTMHHQQPPQPTTPPTLQDLKSPATHMQAPPTHQMPPHLQQQAPPQIFIQMNRPGGPSTQFQRGGPTGSNRPPRPNLMQGQSYGPGQHGQPVPYQGMAGLTQPTAVSVMNFALPQGGGNRYFVQGYTNNHYQYLPVYPQHVVRGPLAPNSQMLMQQQQPPVPQGVIPQPIEQTTNRAPAKKRSNAIKITHPDDGHDVLEEYYNEKSSSTPPGSGQSSARETPQLPTASSDIVIEFARKVASTLGDEAVVRPGSRNSIHSESEPLKNNEVQQPKAVLEAAPLAKLEPESVVMTAVVSNEMPLVENNIEYVPPPREVPRWPIHQPMDSSDPMCVPAPVQPHLVVISGHEEMMNTGLHQQRGFQGWPQEPPHISPVPVMGPGIVPPMGMPNTVAPVHIPPPSMKKPERDTPVVSALAEAPIVDISRDYPALGGQRHGTHHQSPARKRRPNRPEMEQQEQQRAASPSLAATVPVPSIAPALVPPPPAAAAAAASASLAQPVSAPEPVAEVQKTEVPVPVPHTNILTDNSRHSSPITGPVIEETKQQTELPATERIPTPTPPVDAKANNQKSKSNKRQQRHEQQRQATPPPRPVTPAAAVTAVQPVVAAVETVVEPVKPLPVVAAAPTSSPVPDAVLVPAPTTTAPTQLPREPSPAPAPKVSPVVDEQAQKLANMKLQDSKSESLVNDEKREERKVAAMNEENEKLTASNKLANISDIDNIATDIKVSKTGQENNNVPNITVVVEPAEPTPEPTPVIENPKPIVLKHPYKDDQWSPLNRDGKKQYGRDFLIALQNEPQSKKRPDNLPELEVLRDMRSGGSLRGPLPSQRSDSGPYMNKSSSLRGNSGRDSVHLKRGSLLGKQKSQKPMPIQLSLSLNEEVKLRESDTPWKPSRTADQTELTEEDKKTEMLYKKVRGVLNRLTPENFHKLLAQVRGLPIDTTARLEGVIDLVFVKAVDEPGFSVTYSELCRELGKFSVAESNFRVILLQRCQQEFEKSHDLELNRDERIKEIELETDPDAKKEMTALLEEDERKIRVKSVGNIRFVGELYKKNMLAVHIMFSCIDNLLRLATEESFECLCKLLTTIGSKLETDLMTSRESFREAVRVNNKENIAKFEPVASADLNKYFTELDNLVKNKSKKISSRVRFMIQDLIELREQRWVPRREDSAPKTVDQIVKDAEREQLETNLAISAAGLDNRRMGGSGGRQDSRNNPDNRNKRGGGGGGGVQDNNGGWNHVSSGNNYSKKQQYVETNKLRVNQMEMDLGVNMSLGNRDVFIWNKGSGSKLGERKQSGGGFSITSNKFALLEEKPHSRSSSLTGNLPSGADSRENRERPARPSLHDDSRSSRNNQQFKQNPVSRESTPIASAQVESLSGQLDVHVPLVLDSEAIELAAKSMIVDFVSGADFAEASATLEETFADSVKGEMILSILNTSLERSEAHRRAAAKLLAHFMKTGGITQAHLIEGLKGFMEQVDDLIVDIPRLWDYFAELIADTVAEGLSLSVILDILGPPTSTTQNAIAVILRVIAANNPNSPSLAASVPVLRAYFASTPPYQSFLKDYKLEFLENAPAPTLKIDEAQVTAELVEMMRKREHFDKITDWIDKKFGKAVHELPFIKALANAFLEFGLSQGKNDTWKLDTESMRRYVNLMSRYVDNQADRELQCLFCIQAKMNQLEHPQGMLCEICSFLIDTGIHSAESFKSWKSSTDPRGMEGHGVCMASLVSFFTVIEEDDDDPPTS